MQQKERKCKKKTFFFGGKSNISAIENTSTKTCIRCTVREIALRIPSPFIRGTSPPMLRILFLENLIRIRRYLVTGQTYLLVYFSKILNILILTRKLLFDNVIAMQVRRGKHKEQIRALTSTVEYVGARKDR